LAGLPRIKVNFEVLKEVIPMKKQKPSWLKDLPFDTSELSFDELRNLKEADRLLTEDIPGPEGWAYFIKCYRFLLLYACATIEENRFPPLTRCWNELDTFFMREEVFSDEIFVQSWILFDFPFGENGQTVLDYFEDFIMQAEGGENFRYFIEQMRKSRLGVYQEILSSKWKTKFRELITGNTIETFRSVRAYKEGEIFLTRLVDYQGRIYQFGDPKCWPREYKSQIEDFVREKMSYFDGSTPEEKYTKLMKLGGPYWMSCVTANPDFPILSPHHYLKYLRD
jgi:hypothetical protein